MKACEPSVVSPSGSSILSNAEHLVEGPRIDLVFTPAGIVTLFRPVHPAKRLRESVVIFSGTTTSASALQS